MQGHGNNLPAGWIKPRDDDMNPGDYVLYCPHCGWRGEVNTAYAPPPHYCPFRSRERIWRKDAQD